MSSTTPFIKVTEEQFTELLQLKLDDFWSRSIFIFRNYGERFSYFTTTALFFANIQGRTHKILNTLELHRETTGTSDLEVTEETFSRIWKMLGMKTKRRRLLAA